MSTALLNPAGHAAVLLLVRVLVACVLSPGRSGPAASASLMTRAGRPQVDRHVYI
jgi:hypothetical protein